MRKRLVILFCFILLVALMCGCDKKNAAVDEGTFAKSSTVETTPAVQKTVESQLTVVETTAVEKEPETTAENPYELDWQEIEIEWEDKFGYSFEATVLISPWINAKNQECLQYNWGDIAPFSAPLPEPTPESWGLKHYSDGWARYNDNYGAFSTIQNVTDVYYCIGNVVSRNITSNWSITQPTTSDSIWISACQPETDVEGTIKHPSKTENHTRSKTISKIFFDDGTVTNPTWGMISPVYTSNGWGPVPFVFAHFENKTPNCPEGEYRSEMEDTYFCINSQTYFIWKKEMSELNYVKLDVIE